MRTPSKQVCKMNNPSDYQPRFRSIRADARDAAFRCVWFHHAGGASNTLAFRFRQAEAALRAMPAFEVLTPIPPLREDAGDEDFDGTLHELADLYTAVLSEEHSIGAEPFVVVGHSYGTVLAYEVTSRLIARGIRPHRLVVMSFPAPDRLTHQTQLHTLDDRALVQQVDELFGGMPADILNDAASLKFFVPGLRLDLGLLERYRPDGDPPALPIAVTAMVGTDDRAVDLADVQRWNLFVEPPVRMQTLPGDHFFPLTRLPEVIDAAVWDLPATRSAG